MSFTLPEGAKCEQGDGGRTPGKPFQRSPRKASPKKGHFRYDSPAYDQITCVLQYIL